MTTKVLLDTDISVLGDIDDAVTLDYLIHQPECCLLGITTVGSDTVASAKVASAICTAARVDVPVFPGAPQPLMEGARPLVDAHDFGGDLEVVSGWPHQEQFPMGEALPFMRSVIEQNPGEVVLLAIGPLTNLGLLFSLWPDTARLLRGVVSMSGLFGPCMPGSNPHFPREWNALADPYAAAIVYRQQLPFHRSVGANASYHVKMEAQEFLDGVNGAPGHEGRPMLDFARAWFRQASSITFWDTVTASTIFDDTLCSLLKGTVDVELTSAKLQGYTHWSPCEIDWRHEVAAPADAERFFQHYLSVVRREALQPND